MTSEAMCSIPGFRRCLAPGCVSGQIHEGGAEEPIVTCNDCGSKSCFTHQTAWHAGETCEDFDERMAEERREEDGANAAYMEGNTKRCPNVECQSPIEKNGGCRHMTCKLPFSSSSSLFSSPSTFSSSSSSPTVVHQILHSLLAVYAGFR